MALGEFCHQSLRCLIWAVGTGTHLHGGLCKRPARFMTRWGPCSAHLRPSASISFTSCLWSPLPSSKVEVESCPCPEEGPQELKPESWQVRLVLPALHPSPAANCFPPLRHSLYLGIPEQGQGQVVWAQGTSQSCSTILFVWVPGS